MSANWKWFFETPLAPAWRSRLELSLGVALSAAAVVALSSAIRPDPTKLAALRGAPVGAWSALPATTAEIAPKPEITPELIAAVESGDVAAMKKAYRPGMPLEGMLAMAARSGHKDAVVWLLAHGANIHDEERSVQSPLLAADAFPEIAALFRARGVAEPSLEQAAAANAPNALRRVLAAHPNRAKHGFALHSAAGSTVGTPSAKRLVVTMLLEAGAPPNDASGGGSALGAAVQGCEATFGNESLADDCMTIVRLLLDRGARVTGDALGAALSLEDARRPAPLEALLEHPIATGVTAAALARATRVSTEDLGRIVKLGVDWTWHDGEEDAELPLLAAVRRGDRDYTRALLDAGAPVDVHFEDGSSALAEAIDHSADAGGYYARIVELLVARGAEVNRRFPDGRTPLFAAAESGNIRVVNFLLARGARVNDRILDDSALDAAEQHGNVPAARVLAAHGGRRGRPLAH